MNHVMTSDSELPEMRSKGTSQNEDFRARARKYRAQNRNVYDIHEDSSTGLTRLSCEKAIFRGALKSAPVFVLLLALSAQDISAQQETAGQADEQAVTKTEDAAEAGAVAPQQAETKETQQPPAQFIPRETISPDSVIAFPADI